MRLKTSNGWIDYDLNLYRDIARPIDEQVERLYEVIVADFSTADMFGYPTTVEHLLGVGLAAAQVYVVSAIADLRAPRPAALSVGPRLASGPAVIELINHGANFWKHADEWDWDAPDWRRDAILRAFADAGFDENHFALIELVTKVTGADRPSLVELSPFLDEWRVALDDTSRTSQAKGRSGR